MAHPKRSLLAILDIARQIPQRDFSIKKLRATAEGGSHERCERVYLARQIELGVESAARLTDLPSELREAVHLPDLGEKALESLVDVNPNALTSHAVAVTMYNLATKLEQQAQDSAHRQVRRVMEDTDRHVAMLQAQLAARDVTVQSAEQRVQLLASEAERFAEAMVQLRAENADLVARVSRLTIERETMTTELDHQKTRLDEMLHREEAETVALLKKVLALHVNGPAKAETISTNGA